jgi:hypothetical protein
MYDKCIFKLCINTNIPMILQIVAMIRSEVSTVKGNCYIHIRVYMYINTYIYIYTYMYQYIHSDVNVLCIIAYIYVSIFNYRYNWEAAYNAMAVCDIRDIHETQ